MPVAIALLSERARAEGARVGALIDVDLHMVLHIGKLVKFLQAHEAGELLVEAISARVQERV